MANLAWLRDDFDQALTHQSQALAFAEELGDVKLQGQILTSLGDPFRSLGRSTEAKDAFAQAIARKRAAHKPAKPAPTICRPSARPPTTVARLGAFRPVRPRSAFAIPPTWSDRDRTILRAGCYRPPCPVHRHAPRCQPAITSL